MSLANTITLFRLILFPIIFYLLFQESSAASLLAIILLLLAILSDVLDGYFARKRKEITRMGSFLDPFVDKILVYGLLFAFFLQNLFWFWIIVFFLFRDFIVMGIRWIASRDDVYLPEEKYRKALLVSLFGVVFGLLGHHFFSLQYNLSGMLIASMIYLLLTLASIVLALTSIIHNFTFYLRGLYHRRKSGKAISQEKLVILANRKSGGYKDLYRRRLLKMFARRRKAEMHYLPNISNMYFGLRDKLKNIKHLVIAGGDGSFESALNYKPFWKKSVGFFPLGSGNAFYSYFYKGKRFEYLRSRFPFREMKLDVLKLQWEGKTIHTTFICIGGDAEVIHHRPPHTFGFSGYVRSCWKVLQEVKFYYPLVCTVDGKKHIFSNAINLTLAKVPYYGFALRSIVGKVKPDDGKVYATAVVNTHAKIWNKPVRVLGLFMAAMNLNKPPLVPLQGKKIVVQSEQPFPLQAGGEFLGYTTEIKVQVVRRQKVLVV